jgi:hypothetical protein
LPVGSIADDSLERGFLASVPPIQLAQALREGLLVLWLGS